jgi:hypothetical protein
VRQAQSVLLTAAIAAASSSAGSTALDWVEAVVVGDWVEVGGVSVVIGADAIVVVPLEPPQAATTIANTVADTVTRFQSLGPRSGVPDAAPAMNGLYRLQLGRAL